MKREVNMRSCVSANDKEKNKKKENNKEQKGIVTDPFGSWTGVCEDDKYESPVQDADDL